MRISSDVGNNIFACFDAGERSWDLCVSDLELVLHLDLGCGPGMLAVAGPEMSNLRTTVTSQAMACFEGCGP